MSEAEGRMINAMGLPKFLLRHPGLNLGFRFFPDQSTDTANREYLSHCRHERSPLETCRPDRLLVHHTAWRPSRPLVIPPVYARDDPRNGQRFF
jgi:hypothetical protein